MKRNIHKDHPKQIFMLTDGAVPCPQHVIKMVGRNSQNAKLHAIGIGQECSRELILGCAEEGRGMSAFISDLEDPSLKIIEILSKAISPAISSISIKMDEKLICNIHPKPE